VINLEISPHYMAADEPQPLRKRPRILPGEDIDEKSKKV